MTASEPGGRTIAAIILAAGAATRYRARDSSVASKVLAPINGVAMVRIVAETALAAGCAPVVVVTGNAAQDVEQALGSLPLICVENEDYKSGIASSLRTGLDALPDDCAGAFILLADMPKVSAALLRGMMDLFSQHGDVDALTPVHAGQRGNPVLLAQSLFARARALRGDEGARKLLLQDNVRVLEVAAEEGALIDVDTPDMRMRVEQGD